MRKIAIENRDELDYERQNGRNRTSVVNYIKIKRRAHHLG